MEPWVMVTGGLQLFLTALLQAAAGAAGPLNAPKLKLFVNDVDPGVGSVIGDFTLASFTGSAPVNVTWGDKFVNSTGLPEIVGSLAQWTYVSGPSETVFGVLLTDASDALLGYSRLTNPKVFTTTTDSLGVVPRLQVPSDGWKSPVRVTNP